MMSFQLDEKTFAQCNAKKIKRRKENRMIIFAGGHLRQRVARWCWRAIIGARRAFQGPLPRCDAASNPFHHFSGPCQQPSPALLRRDIVEGTRPPPMRDTGLGDWPHGWQSHASRTRTLYFRERLFLPTLSPAARRPSPLTIGASRRSMADGCAS